MACALHMVATGEMELFVEVQAAQVSRVGGVARALDHDGSYSLSLHLQQLK